MDNENLLLKPGSICFVSDPIDPAYGLVCTLKLIEQDPISGGIFYYFIANREECNILTDPRFPWRYCCVLESTSNRVIPLNGPSN